MIKKEVNNLETLYNTVFAKFLSAIDHLGYHPTLGKKKNKKDKIEITHSKRFLQTGTYEPKQQYDDLDEAESLFLDDILKVTEKIDPTLHKELKRVKRFSLMSWIMGWGVFSNAKAISKLRMISEVSNFRMFCRNSRFWNSHITLT